MAQRSGALAALSRLARSPLRSPLGRVQLRFLVLTRPSVVSRLKWRLPCYIRAARHPRARRYQSARCPQAALWLAPCARGAGPLSVLRKLMNLVQIVSGQAIEPDAQALGVELDIDR